MITITAFTISVTRPGGRIDPDRLRLSPGSAARLDPDKFLEFAEAITKAAHKVKMDRLRQQAQLSLGLETKETFDENRTSLL